MTEKKIQVIKMILTALVLLTGAYFIQKTVPSDLVNADVPTSDYNQGLIDYGGGGGK